MFLITAILDAILSFLESCRGILQGFQYVILPIFLELRWKFQLVLSYFKHTTNVFVEMTAILDAILDFLESSSGILQDFWYVFLRIFWTYSENLSLSRASSNIQVIFFENDIHFGRHIEFLGQLQGDCPELLVCYSTNFSGLILKISACSELIQAYK